MTSLESLSLKFKPEDVVKYQPPKVKALSPNSTVPIPTPEKAREVREINPAVEFSVFSRCLSSNLKSLYIENTCSSRSGHWDLSGLCEGLQNLESLTLCYMPEGTRMNKPWSGKSLKGIFLNNLTKQSSFNFLELEIRCCKDIGFEAFLEDHSKVSMNDEGQPMQLDEPITNLVSHKINEPLYKIRNVRIVNRNSNSW